ncbi:dihydrodipicolinate synthase family protein [Streptomyces camponoticapitis]|uniref:Dihydrodipicolinate synthase family protein n=1 Tax=Streptomyces camponoticapitis TaxID=1616125 RepID=A0ABQ2E6B8_9ACTN|nr:dihydrodipicolinate synthase family protein [Streptomyces camponoticapitis]GGJ90768.1 dihydrodipicolinate synthase family protein [Streptomyces camponoticapitis]
MDGRSRGAGGKRLSRRDMKGCRPGPDRDERRPADGRALLAGVMVPLVTPMDRRGRPSAPAADALLGALAAAGARSLMLFGSNGEGPLLPTARLGDFATGVAKRWRELTDGGPVLMNVTAPGTAEALARAEAVLPAGPDALVLSPPIYYHHRHDEIVTHYASMGGLGVPVVAYNAPRYSNPLTPHLLDEVTELPHLVGIKDSSGDLALFGHAVAAARRRDDFGVSQGAEGQALDGLRLGADGVVPGVANLTPGAAVELFRAHSEGRDDDARGAQRLLDQVLALHTVRPGVPAVKAVLAARGLCPPHVAAPFTPCSEQERSALLDLIAPLDAHLIRA